MRDVLLQHVAGEPRHHERVSSLRITLKLARHDDVDRQRANRTHERSHAVGQLTVSLTRVTRVLHLMLKTDLTNLRQRVEDHPREGVSPRRQVLQHSVDFAEACDLHSGEVELIKRQQPSLCAHDKRVLRDGRGGREKSLADPSGAVD